MISLREVAKNKKDIYNELSDKSGQIMRHLLKYLYIDNEDLRDHWAKEIYSFINQVSKFKHNNKFPDKKFIMKSTYSVWQDVVDHWITHGILNEYHFNVFKYDSNTFHTFAESYFMWLSTRLSDDGFVTLNDVEKRLKALLVVLSDDV